MVRQYARAHRVLARRRNACSSASALTAPRRPAPPARHRLPAPGGRAQAQARRVRALGAARRGVPARGVPPDLGATGRRAARARGVPDDGRPARAGRRRPRGAAGRRAGAVDRARPVARPATRLPSCWRRRRRDDARRRASSCRRWPTTTSCWRWRDERARRITAGAPGPDAHRAAAADDQAAGRRPVRAVRPRGLAGAAAARSAARARDGRARDAAHRRAIAPSRA